MYKFHALPSRRAAYASATLHAMEPTVLRLEIRGRVQGVGFRASMAGEARRLGLGGWVRNRRDGWVEATVAGPDAAVQQLLQWARRGPPAARVDSVQSFAGGRPSDGFDSFDSFDSFVSFEQWPSC